MENKVDLESAARKDFLVRQDQEINQVFRFTAAENTSQQKFESLALDTYDALKASKVIRVTPFSPRPYLASNPLVSTNVLERLPAHIRSRWAEWKEEYELLITRSPKLALYDMLALISETNCFESWPTGLETRIRDWVDSGNLEPAPVYDRLEIITPEFYRQLGQIRNQCQGWLKWDGKEVQFIPDPA